VREDVATFVVRDRHQDAVRTRPVDDVPDDGIGAFVNDVVGEREERRVDGGSPQPY
jgi:hypothetical protein